MSVIISCLLSESISSLLAKIEHANEGQVIREGKLIDLRVLTRRHIANLLRSTNTKYAPHNFLKIAHTFMTNPKARSFAIGLRGSGHIVGDASLIQLDPTEKGWAMGISIDIDYQNRGLGTDAVQLLIAEAQSTRDRIWLTVDSENHRAYRVYEKCGFKHIDTRSYIVNSVASHAGAIGDKRIEHVMEIQPEA